MKALIIMTFVILTSLISDSYSQIIHKNDLEYFIGCFPRTDTLDRRSFDCTEFAEWYIIKPDSIGKRRDFSKIKQSRDKHWVSNSNEFLIESGTLKHNRYLKDLNGFIFYIMMDFWGHELQMNVLTVWKPVGRDSLEYYCGQKGKFDTSIGDAKIERVDVFPDSVILLVANLGGQGCNKVSFFQGKTPCYFDEFYIIMENHPISDEVINFTYTYFNFKHSRRPEYKATEITEYKHLNLVEDDYMHHDSFISIDSATAKVIDLWEMAKQHRLTNSEDCK